MLKKFACLSLLILAGACAGGHCPHCATAKGHAECCGGESGYCDHGAKGDHGKHNADYHNQHAH